MGASESIRESFEESGAEGPHDGNYQLACPFCPGRVGKDDGKKKLTVRTSGRCMVRPKRGMLPEPHQCTPEEAVWSCFRCHAAGVDDLSWLMTAQPPTEATLAQDERTANEPMPPGGFKPLDLGNKAHWAAIRYLDGRGIPGEPPDGLPVSRAVQAAAGLGVAEGLGSDRRYRGRVVIPCLDPDTRAWLGFVARDVTGRSEIPYMTPRRMPRGRIVAGLEDEALREPGAPIYVVEGQFDRLALFPYAWATLGKGVQPEQLDLMAARARAWGRKLVPCLDGDAPGDNRRVEWALRARGADVPGRIELPPGQDPSRVGWDVQRYFVGQ
jgi:hypothetical protein